MRPVLKKDFCAYLQVVRDDICLFEVCESLLKQGIKTFFFFQPSHYWSGEVVPDDYTDELHRVQVKLQRAGATTALIRRDVTFLDGETRIDTETNFRNTCLNDVRGFGFNHILVVDGDELWTGGTFHRIWNLARRGTKAVAVGMIPVVGIPPYPVEGAKDTATAYVGPGVKFVNCRGVNCKLATIPARLIYHFTGVRPTMAENILKHKRSGHYDDPKYDYEGWLNDKLPNLAPGQKNIHFYKPYQIWPELRDWKPGEKEAMPPSIFAATR